MGKDRQVRNPVTGWWETVPDPRAVPVLVALSYVFMVAGGVEVLLDAPAFLAVALGGYPLTTYWGALLVFGGLLGVPSALLGNPWVERVALAALGLAMAMYVVGTVELAAHTNGAVQYQSWLTLALVAHLAVRVERIRSDTRRRRPTTRTRPRGQ